MRVSNCDCGFTPLGVSLLAAASLYHGETLWCAATVIVLFRLLQVAKAGRAMVHFCPFRSLVSGSACIPLVTYSCVCLGYDPVKKIAKIRTLRLQQSAQQRRL